MDFGSLADRVSRSGRIPSGVRGFATFRENTSNGVAIEDGFLVRWLESTGGWEFRDALDALSPGRICGLPAKLRGDGYGVDGAEDVAHGHGAIG